jgi:hypothetical protein
MHQMLATATAMASCTRTDTQTNDTKKQPTVTPDPTQSSPPPPVPSESATLAAVDPPPTAPTATVSAPTHPAPMPTKQTNAGYMVVDMLPAPARCMGVAAGSRATGHFVTGSTGVVLRVTATVSTANVAFSMLTPGVMAGQLLTSSYPTSTSAEVDVMPQGGKMIGVTLPLTCNGRGTGTLFVHASFTGPPALGRPVAVTLTDY